MKTSTFYPFLLTRNLKKTGLSGRLSMIKKLLLLICFAAPIWSMAQSTTILPDAIGMPKVSVLPVCNTSEKGKQVFNSTDNKMYFCNGTYWQEMTGGGFTLPYTNKVNSADNLLSIENTGSGRAIYGKSTDNISAIKGESFIGTGVYGTSNSNYGIFGSSVSGVGVFGFSSSKNGGYFEANGTEPALYVSNTQGNAAYFDGNVKIKNELVVDDNKGIVRSNTATQQKIVRTTVTLVSTVGPGTFVDSDTYNYEDFGGIPTVTVGQVMNATATGQWYKAVIIPIDVTATGCKFRMVNTSAGSISFNASWQLLIVGPE